MTVTEQDNGTIIITADEGKLLTLKAGGLKATIAGIRPEHLDDWEEVDAVPVS